MTKEENAAACMKWMTYDILLANEVMPFHLMPDGFLSYAMNIGKDFSADGRLLRIKHGEDKIPSRYEYESAAGFWHYARNRALFQSDESKYFQISTSAEEDAKFKILDKITKLLVDSDELMSAIQSLENILIVKKEKLKPDLKATTMKVSALEMMRYHNIDDRCRELKNHIEKVEMLINTALG
jgi:hypothetical protein